MKRLLSLLFAVALAACAATVPEQNLREVPLTSGVAADIGQTPIRLLIFDPAKTHKWAQVGADPDKKGRLNEALAGSGWPKSVIDQLLAKVAAKEFETGWVSGQESLEFVTYGRGVLRGVATTWLPDTHYTSNLYSLENGGVRYVLQHVLKCGNWVGYREVLQPQPTKQPIRFLPVFTCAGKSKTTCC